LQTKGCFHVHFRPVWEGGQYEGDETKRQDALRLAMEFGADYIDIELEVLYWPIYAVKKTH
jgi:3-dehydroquinate dehydratase/shikimate dehydrogenase